MVIENTTTPPPTMTLSAKMTAHNHHRLFGETMSLSENLIDSDLEVASYVCVNPYEVNPIVDEEREFVLRTPVPAMRPKADTAPRTLGASGGHGFSATTNPKIKLEMEEFRDLSSFLLPKPLSTNSVDELNTPVFFKDAFDFDLFSTHKGNYTDELKVKLEYDASNKGNLSPTEKSIDLNILNKTTTNRVHRNEIISSGVSNNNVHLHQQQQQHQLHQHQIFNMNMFSPESENGGSVYNCKISPSSSVDTTTCVTPSVGNIDRHYSNASSPDNSYNFTHHNMNNTNNSGFDTPPPDDSSNSSIITTLGGGGGGSGGIKEEKPMLILNIDMKPPLGTDISNLDTPVIIEEVVDLESSNFNILDLVNNEDLNYLDTDELFIDTSLPTVTLPSKEATTSAIIAHQQSSFLSGKRSRKRKSNYDDDDEDYMPPSKKSSSGKKRLAYYSESESESEEDVRPRRGRPKKGRPPKRAESVSSDGGDASKYRELRDKNNEASRKSRLKRKFKELELEKEAEELNSKNIKLKAQVEELEKMVTNFRDNLFKIMARK